MHVIDISSPDYPVQIQVVEELIARLGAGDKPCVRVYNKCDAYMGPLPRGENVVCISAKTGEGADALMECLAAILGKDSRRVRLRLPYDRSGLIDLLRREGAIQTMAYEQDHISIEAVVKPDLWSRVREFAEETEKTTDDAND